MRVDEAPTSGAAPPIRPVWPRPPSAPGRVVALAASVAGAGAATLLPWGRPGVGWPLTGLVLAAVTVTVAARAARPSDAPTTDGSATSADRSPRSRPAGVFWAVVALGLLSVPALRDAGWLAPWCVLGAAVAGSLAVAGGRSVGGLLLGAIAVPTLAFGALPWAARGLAGARRGGEGNALRVAAAVLTSAVLLVVFTSLLAEGDAAFGRLVHDLLAHLDLDWVPRLLLLFPPFAAATLATGYLLSASPRPDPALTDRPGRLRRVEWALPVGVLVALFGVFVAVQISTLFGGGAHVLRTTGLTYAEYARGGFWQLLAVTVLTLGVIAVAARCALTGTPADRAWLRGLLGVLAGLTLVIVASALSRMWAYQQAYGFTVLRVLVSSVELWLGVVYLLVIAAGYRLRAPWLPRAVLGTGLTALLVIGVANPDRFIAEHNVQRWERTGKIDTRYLGELSADAVPALLRLPEPLRGCSLGSTAFRLDDAPDGWRNANLGRSTARDLLAGHPSWRVAC
jgi:hypothetical protein